MSTPVRIPALIKSNRYSYDNRGFLIGKNQIYEVDHEEGFKIRLLYKGQSCYLDEEVFLAYLDSGIFEETTEEESNTLPKPFVPEEGQGFFSINRGNYISADLSEQYAYTIADILIGNSYRDWETDRKSTRLNSSHSAKSRMPSSA